LIAGGTKKIKVGGQQEPKQAPKQAPGRGTQRLKLGLPAGGTQRLKLGGQGEGPKKGTQRLKLGSGTQQIGRATQFLTRAPQRKDPNTVCFFCCYSAHFCRL
jgi:hypothetical protein